MSRSAATERLLQSLATSPLAGLRSRECPGHVLVAFSGGPDSCALLWALTRGADLRVTAAHVDHGVDPQSGERMREARRLATRLGVRFVSESLPQPLPRHRGESFEESLRRLRYESLQRLKARVGADVVATGHHADDQAETVVIRLLGGTRLRGLASISRQTRDVVRPLLEVPRRTLEQALQDVGIVPIHDPGNDAPGPLRNRVRRDLLPHLEREGASRAALAAVAEESRRAFGAIDELLADRLALSVNARSAALQLSAWLELPAALQDIALESMHRALGHHYPASRRAVTELRRQLSRESVLCDCGRGLRWRAQGDRLVLEPAPPRTGTHPPDFTYTLEIPGTLRIPEISASILIESADFEERRDDPPGRHARFRLPPDAEPVLVVRNRRPGDRARTGTGPSRRLKRLLPELGIPAPLRAHLPLLCFRNDIMWIPGSPVHPDHRPTNDGRPVWTARLAPEPGSGISCLTSRLHPASAG